MIPQSTLTEEKVRKDYVKPVLQKITLISNETILAICNAASDSGCPDGPMSFVS